MVETKTAANSDFRLSNTRFPVKVWQDIIYPRREKISRRFLLTGIYFKKRWNDFDFQFNDSERTYYKDRDIREEWELVKIN